MQYEKLFYKQSDDDADECYILEPMFTVKFNNIETSKKYWKLIKEYLENLLIMDVPKEYLLPTLSELELHIYAKEKKHNQSFILDNTTLDPDSSAHEVPQYELDFDDPLKDASKIKIPVQQEKEDVIKLCCFNCSGAHKLEECTEEKDQARISENKRIFFANKDNMKSNRYHLEEDPRFSTFRPGYISRKLREALGLSKHQLPYYIYKMRLLGYPPGWLEEARMEKSGIALFDSDGNRITGEEDGEVIEEEYDFRKIIEYPGFNVLPSYDIIDEADYYHMPPILPHNLKINWHFQISKAEIKDKPCVQRNRPPLVENCTSFNERIEEDMELESDNETPILLTDGVNPPLPSDNPVSPPPPPEEDSCGRCVSPSLEDLEAKKHLLLSQLQEEEELSTNKSVLELGTIVPPSVFATKTIPSPEMFAQDICSHIPYENLPNSTGAFKKLSSLLDKVHKRMLELQGSAL